MHSSLQNNDEVHHAYYTTWYGMTDSHSFGESHVTRSTHTLYYTVHAVIINDKIIICYNRYYKESRYKIYNIKWDLLHNIYRYLNKAVRTTQHLYFS